MMEEALVFVSLDELDEALARSEDRTSGQTFHPDIEAELAKLRPFPGWERRAKSLLARMSDEHRAPNPAGWEVSTACNHLKSLRRILEVGDAAGIRIVDFDDLLTAEVLAALHRRVSVANEGDGGAEPPGSQEGSNESPAERSWGYTYLGGLLRSLRTMCGAAKGLETPAQFRQMIAFCSDLRHRRDVSDRILPWADYMAGAKALEALGRIALATGRQQEGEEYRLMAQALAIALDGAPRRSELGHAKRDRIHANLLADEPELDIYVEAETSKVRRARILTIDDPFALRSLEEAMQGPGGRRLFRTADGEPISPDRLYGLIRSATILAVGVPASFNILRKVNSASLETQEERRFQLGQSERSNLADTTYHPDLAARGREKLAKIRDEYTRRAREAVRDSKIDPEFHDQ